MLAITQARALRRMSEQELTQVADLIRSDLIRLVRETGGHLASNLGAVELTVALHASFDTPHDDLVWDVGHQAYAHKWLTGRRFELESLRRAGGVSGYPAPGESEYDAYIGGHAGLSISAALGKALARSGRQSYSVAVIGDASLASGMALEALNHAGALRPQGFLVVLNDNGMSIDPTAGALARRNSYRDLCRAFGLRYLGPVDGHSIRALMGAFKEAKRERFPLLVHVETLKGKGHPQAESFPGKWHSLAPAGKQRAPIGGGVTFSDVFGRQLLELAAQDKRIVALTAAMGSGTGLEAFRHALPDQFIDAGICEQHCVALAAGLASAGKKPVCAIYSTFLQRAFDQVAVDVCLQNLPVVFAIDRAGLVGEDGPTHHGLHDIAILRSLPNVTLMAPKDGAELAEMLSLAVKLRGPVAIRYPRAFTEYYHMIPARAALSLLEPELLRSGRDVLLLTYGNTGPLAEVTARLLGSRGTDCGVMRARTAKPIASEIIEESRRCRLTVTMEDHVPEGGFGSAVLEALAAQGLRRSPVLCIGVQDCLTPHGTIEEQWTMNGLDPESVCERVTSALSELSGQAPATPWNQGRRPFARLHAQSGGPSIRG